MTEHLTTDTLIDYIHGELDAAEDAVTLAHLQACPSCSAAYEVEAFLSESLKRAGHDTLELPSMVKARIWENVRAESASPKARILAFFRPAIAFPVAAALAVALYFASPIAHRAPSGPSVDASYYLEQHAAEEIGNPLGERSVSSAVVETVDTTGSPPALGTRTAAAAALNAVE
jgi:anti-sigma factor RsiW